MEYGYSTEKDQKAAEMLSNMIKRKALRVSQIQKKIEGKEILVIGAGPSLEKNIWKEIATLSLASVFHWRYQVSCLDHQLFSCLRLQSYS